MFGFWVKNLTQGEREQSGYTDSGGVLVTRVDPGSFAEDIGMMARDVITAINRRPVNTIDDVKQIQSRLKPGEPVAFRIMRAAPGARGARADWQPLFLAGTLPANP
jgi:serine protease Do